MTHRKNIIQSFFLQQLHLNGILKCLGGFDILSKFHFTRFSTNIRTSESHPQLRKLGLLKYLNGQGGESVSHGSEA